MRSRALLALSLLLLGSAPLAAQSSEFEGRLSPDRGWVGIAFHPNRSTEILRSAAAPGAAGESPAVVVGRVYPGSPAEHAGVRPGDTVVAVDGRGPAAPILATPLAAGDTLRLRLRRDGEERDLSVVAAPRERGLIILEDAEGARIVDVDSMRRVFSIRLDTLGLHLDSLFRRLDSMRVRLRAEIPPRMVTIHLDSIARDRLERMPFPEPGSRTLAGAELAVVDPALGRYFEAEEGLLVLRVAPRSPAARAGLEVGDVIVGAEGAEAIRSIAELRHVIDVATGPIPLEILRDRRRRVVRLESGR